MSNKIDQMQTVLCQEIANLTVNFSEEDFVEVFSKIKALRFQSDFETVVSWLKELATESATKSANGLLASLYWEITDFERAKQYALRAQQDFPGTDLWSDIFRSAVWDNFCETNGDQGFLNSPSLLC